VGKEAGPVKIEIRHQVLPVKFINLCCKTLGNMAVAQYFYDS
jgi:hypothetical protein